MFVPSSMKVFLPVLLAALLGVEQGMVPGTLDFFTGQAFIDSLSWLL